MELLLAHRVSHLLRRALEARFGALAALGRQGRTGRHLLLLRFSRHRFLQQLLPKERNALRYRLVLDPPSQERDEGLANSFSISRRMRTACAVSSATTSLQATTSPSSTGRRSGTPCANPIGSAPSSSDLRAGIRRPYTVKPPSPSSISPAFRARLATATASPRKPVGHPVGSPRSATLATEIPSSNPIRWYGR